MQWVGGDTKEKGRLLLLIKVSHPPAPYSRLITDCGTEYKWASAASHFTPQPVQPFLFPFIARKRSGGSAGSALDDYRVLLGDSLLRIAVSPINCSLRCRRRLGWRFLTCKSHSRVSQRERIPRNGRLLWPWCNRRNTLCGSRICLKTAMLIKCS